MSDAFIVVGKLTSAYGIKGWLKAYSYTEPKENLFSYSPWFIGDNPKSLTEVTVKNHKDQGKLFQVQLKECIDRNQAEALSGQLIYVPAEQLAELEEGDYYWRDLEGLTVINQQKECLGKVNYLIETGSNDVMVIKSTRESIDKRERMIPYIPEQFIISVDLEQKVITVDWDSEF